MFKCLNTSLLISLSSLSAVAVNAETILEPVLVTASRHSENADQALASTTVITRQDIETSSATSLEELLINVPGLDVKPSGPFGKSTSIFMRGTGSSHTLTLVDGVKLYSATGGSTAFQHIPLSQIERVEIVRGPRSGLYGSEAIGGVIQIFTRKGTAESAGSVTISEGSFNSSAINGGFSGSNGDFSYSVYAGQSNTDGIDSIVHTTANDKDGYANESLSVSVGYKISELLKVDASLLNAEGSTLYDNCYNVSYATSDNCYSDMQQQVIATSLKITPQGIWDAVLHIGSSKDLNDNFWEDAANNTYITEHSSVSLQNNFQLTENQLLIAGIDQTQDKVEATPYGVFDNTRDNTGVFASWSGQAGMLNMNASIRSDDNEQFGVHTTGNVGAGYQLENNLNLFVSYGTAFKAPTFNELYFPFYGSPTLVPEESVSTEIGLKQKSGWGHWELSLYQTTVDNLINYDSALFLANNISKAEIQGVELSVAGKVAGWNLALATSFVEPLNKDAAYLDNILPSRVQQSTTLTAAHTVDNANYSITVLSQGKRFTDANNTNQLDAYTVVDLTAGYKLNKNLMLAAKLNNVFDEDYALNGFTGTTYSTPGRAVFVSMTYKM